jgi:hypothetical protein
MGVPAAVPRLADVEPTGRELRDRIVTGMPVVALVVAAWNAWEGLLRPGEPVV